MYLDSEFGFASIFESGRESLGRAGIRTYEGIETVASETKAEISGYVQAIDIYVTGSVI
jgi:hypothetical protein